MKVEVVHIEDCPNWEEAGRRLRTALDMVGASDVVVDYRLLATRDDAEAVWFAGSPTILVDGVDVFPNGGRVTDLACRVFQTEHGTISRLPTLEQFVRALRERR